MGMYGFNFTDTMSIVICVGGSWEKGIDFKIAQVTTEKQYHLEIKQLLALKEDSTKKTEAIEKIKSEGIRR